MRFKVHILIQVYAIVQLFNLFIFLVNSHFSNLSKPTLTEDIGEGKYIYNFARNPYLELSRALEDTRDSPFHLPLFPRFAGTCVSDQLRLSLFYIEGELFFT